jgi:MoxR-like ATPase
MDGTPQLSIMFHGYYVDPEDVRAIAGDVFRHRLGLTYEAQGEGVTPDQVTEEIVRQVALP